MTPRTWAEKTVEDLWYRGHQHVDDMSKLLQAEHARSVRIVKAEIKRVKKNQYQFTHGAKDSVLNELQRVLELLQRGRTGRGK